MSPDLTACARAGITLPSSPKRRGARTPIAAGVIGRDLPPPIGMQLRLDSGEPMDAPAPTVRSGSPIETAATVLAMRSRVALMGRRAKPALRGSAANIKACTAGDLSTPHEYRAMADHREVSATVNDAAGCFLMSDGMNPRQWFVLGIRLFGVWLPIEGVGFVANFLDLRLGLGLVPETGRPAGYLLYAASISPWLPSFLLAPASWHPGAKLRTTATLPAMAMSPTMVKEPSPRQRSLPETEPRRTPRRGGASLRVLPKALREHPREVRCSMQRAARCRLCCWIRRGRLQMALHFRNAGQRGPFPGPFASGSRNSPDRGGSRVRGRFRTALGRGGAGGDDAGADAAPRCCKRVVVGGIGAIAGGVGGAERGTDSSGMISS